MPLPTLTRDNLATVEAEARATPRPKDCIRVCVSTCCLAAGADRIHKRLVEEVRTRNLDIEIRKTGCAGMCHAEPLVQVDVAGTDRAVYGHLDEEKAVRILDEHAVGKTPVRKWAIDGIEHLPAADTLEGIGPAGHQYRLVLRHCGIIDPTNIEDYLARGGYSGLRRAIFELGPEATLEEIKASGLRGRGGAGFPTGTKWELTRKAPGAQKYIICNGDEGDPGAYMDRTVLESDPHAVIEGMLIGAFAMGCSQGYFYIRAEYPLAVDRIEAGIKAARRVGLIGKSVMGSEFACDMEVRLGAGAFVCGEETALIASVEGHRGTPSPRPPYPSQKGLWGMPTCINNVETLANIAPIVTRGGAWYAGLGSGRSKGTKVFALTGKLKNPGLVEIEMGTTIRAVVMDIGGGSATASPIKAIQTGGPSGGVIPAKFFDTPITYESLAELGSIMGSGGLIVMDGTDNMVEVAKFFMDFSVDESCGKCAPCRIGCKQLMLLLEKVSEGRAEPGDLDTMRQLANAMRRASLCGLGQTAANPVLSTLRYYPEEYQALLRTPATAGASQ